MKSIPVEPASPYLLFFRNTGAENHKHLSADHRQELISRWNAWYDGLLDSGKAVDGQPLEPETRVVSGQRGQRVVDGPFPETKEAIGGYVLLQVSGWDEATEIAQRHPGLEYGMQIEIRQMVSHCHLGVNVGSKAARATAASSSP